MNWEKRVDLKLFGAYLIAGLAVILAFSTVFTKVSQKKVNEISDKIEVSQKEISEISDLIAAANTSEVQVLKELIKRNLPPKEGQSWCVPLSQNGLLEMVWIEPGHFSMGSPKNEKGREVDELQHKVKLSNGYWLGKYEVTQWQWRQVMDTTDRGILVDYPVCNVNWNDAKNFCERLTQLERAAGRLPEGYVYTLPTEAQWEYACRAGTATALNNGGKLEGIDVTTTITDKNGKEQKITNIIYPDLDKVAWHKGNSGQNNAQKAHPVGQKDPNAWKLYDMHGNVWEWCLDWYGSYVDGSESVDPFGPDANTENIRVRRGGCYVDDPPIIFRSADRAYSNATNKSEHVGFRLALVRNKREENPEQK